MLNNLILTSLIFGCSLVASPSWAQDDYDHYHGDQLNHLLHDYGIPHSHGYAGDAHEYNHYLHDRGIPHVHAFPRRCDRIVDHDRYGWHFYREVCQ